MGCNHNLHGSTDFSLLRPSLDGLCMAARATCPAITMQYIHSVPNMLLSEYYACGETDNGMLCDDDYERGFCGGSGGHSLPLEA